MRDSVARRWLSAIALGALLAVTGCGGSDGGSSTSSGSASAKAAGTTLKVRVGFLPAFGTLPIHIAETKGFFKRNGLDVTTTEATDIATFAPALGRQYDFIHSTPVDFLTAASRGIDIKAAVGVHATSKDVPNNAVVTNNDSIHSIEDLKGKHVGVISLAGTGYQALRYILQKHGIDKDQIDLTAVPLANQADQLKAGRIDAASSAIPFWTPLVNSHYRILFDPIVEASGHDSSIVGFLSTSSKFAQAHPEAVPAMRKSISEAIDWIRANQTQARTELQNWLGVPAAVAKSAPLPPFQATVTADDLKPWVDVVKTVGGLQNVPDANSLVVTP